MADAAEDRERIQDDAEGVTSGAGGPQTARRRLMLGAAAALPSVFTLTSGAQTAVASNALCWGRGPRNPGDPAPDPAPGNLSDLDAERVPRLSMTKDEWLRKEVYYGVSNGRPAYCALDEQANCIEPYHPGKAATGSVWIIDGDQVTVGPDVSITQISSKPEAYALVYVDRDGLIVTVNSTSPELRPVTGNCWNSILGGRGPRSNVV